MSGCPLVPHRLEYVPVTKTAYALGPPGAPLGIGRQSNLSLESGVV